MPRAIRDPIHGNIPLKELAGAVVDTLAFQRLRYVRQNGLLHFVFPGATHTRFAHSIGAMHVATRVWGQLSQNFEGSAASEYVGAVFELAALLHDVGHCAFSHSIESIKIKGKDNVPGPLLGRVRTLFEEWGEPELLRFYLKAKSAELEKTQKAVAESDVKHEQTGLILAKRILTEPSVAAVCRDVLHADAQDVAADVISLMQFGMPATSHLKDALSKLPETAKAKSYVSAKSNDFVLDMMLILAGLISGTLDVDRMDYLLRDSFYCGVSYGRIDMEHIIAGLGLATHNGRTYLTIKEKAVLAVDDLLWSRHQMFLQVYGHKTNVALNRTLELALPEAMGEIQDLDPPLTYNAYLEFTDDFVLSKIFSLCFHEKTLGNRGYARLLARREVPEHLFELRMPTLTSDTNTPEVFAERDRLAKERGVDASKVLFAPSANEIIKKGVLPSVLVEDHLGGFDLVRYRNRSSLYPVGKDESALPPRYAMVHFFIDRRDAVQPADPAPLVALTEKIPPAKPQKLPKKPAAPKPKKK